MILFEGRNPAWLKLEHFWEKVQVLKLLMLSCAGTWGVVGVGSSKPDRLS